MNWCTCQVFPLWSPSPAGSVGREQISHRNNLFGFISITAAGRQFNVHALQDLVLSPGVHPLQSVLQQENHERPKEPKINFSSIGIQNIHTDTATSPCSAMDQIAGGRWEDWDHFSLSSTTVECPLMQLKCLFMACRLWKLMRNWCFIILNFGVCPLVTT